LSVISRPAMWKTLLSLILLLSGTASVAHSAAKCDCGIGQISVFDIDMRQLPDAYASGDTAELLRRRALYMLSPRFGIRAFSTGECGRIFKIDSAIFLGGGGMKWGLSQNVAPAGRVTSLDYLFAGEMTIQGSAYVVNVRLEAAYSREVVRTATASIPIVDPDPAQSGPPMSVLAATVQLVEAAAESLAAEFRPLSALITEWERQKRSDDTGIARSNPDGKLVVKPQRLRMKKGETVRVDLIMTDCDDKPLGNRPIRFSRGEWNEMAIPGTTGGSIKPGPVETDGAGRATVEFTATASKGTGNIRGWYGHHRPSGVPNVVFGEVQVVIMPDPVEPEPVEIVKGPEREWRGTVTVSTSQDVQYPHAERPEIKVRESGSAQLTCQVTGVNNTASCSYSSSHSVSSSRGSLTTSMNASGASTSVTLSVVNGKLNLDIGSIPVTVSGSSSVVGDLGTSTGEVGRTRYVVPASSDPNRQSGSWTDPNPFQAKLGITKTVNWSFSR
jgi:hypothetical protein